MKSDQQRVTCPTQLLKVEREQEGFIFLLSPAEKLIKAAVLTLHGATYRKAQTEEHDTARH